MAPALAPALALWPPRSMVTPRFRRSVMIPRPPPRSRSCVRWLASATTSYGLADVVWSLAAWRSTLALVFKDWERRPFRSGRAA